MTLSLSSLPRYMYNGIELNFLQKQQAATSATVFNVQFIPKLYAGTIGSTYSVLDYSGSAVMSQLMIFHLDHALFLLTNYRYP